MTSRQKLLALLDEAGTRGVTTGQILAGGIGSRYGARIKELRNEGHAITAERIRDGSWLYRLVADIQRTAGNSSDPARPTRSSDRGEHLSRQSKAPAGHDDAGLISRASVGRSLNAGLVSERGTCNPEPPLGDGLSLGHAGVSLRDEEAQGVAGDCPAGICTREAGHRGPHRHGPPWPTRGDEGEALKLLDVEPEKPRPLSHWEAA